jgi:RNA polymerase sigma factor (TIGR02999 family)
MAEAEITELLNRWSSGDSAAFDQLLPIVYADLKRHAARFLASEHRAPTFDCTVLVHEAYIRLVDQNRIQWSGRAHFFGAAAQTMRRILVDHARERLAQKRGSGAEHAPLDAALTLAQEPDLDVIALDDALREFAEMDPERSRIVELRYFAGLSIDETASVLGVSASSITRDWAFARAWLYRRIRGDASR